MNRTEKKCFLGALASHGLLALAFLFGSAFFNHAPSKPPVITFEQVPFNFDKTTDGHSTGGNIAAPPPAKSTQPDKPAPVERAQPKPPPVAVKPPEPVKPKETVKPKEVAHEKEQEQNKHKDGNEPPKPKTGKKVTNTATNDLHNLTSRPIKRSVVDLAAIRAQQEAEAQADRDYQQNKQKWVDVAGALNGAKNGIGKGLTGRIVSVDGQNGLGSGPATANWRAAVGELYTRAWVPPSDADTSSTVDARVTIARNGEVLTAHIVRYSGDAALDGSVQRVLKRVRQAPPLPDNAREDQRTVTITFDLKVKQALG